MKLFRFALNIWITIVSVGSFLFGWVALAHAPKPVQHNTQPQVTISSSAALPTLTPLQSLSSGGDDGNFPLFQAPSNNFNSNNGFNSAPQPIFRTGGS